MTLIHCLQAGVKFQIDTRASSICLLKKTLIVVFLAKEVHHELYIDDSGKTPILLRYQSR